MIGVLSKLLPHKTIDLEAKLAGVAGHTGWGELEYSLWSNGEYRYEVELRGVAGQTAIIYIDGIKIKTLRLDNGRLDHSFTLKEGGGAVDFNKGAVVEIHQHGEPILAGVFQPD